MRLFKKWPVRLSLFLAGFLALAGLADLILVPLGSREVLGAYDFIHADNADVVFIGDSLCIYQINPGRFEEITGKSALNYGIGSAKAKSHVTMAREVFRLKKPQKLVVVFDPEIDIVRSEDTAVIVKFSPVIGSARIRAQYLLDQMEYTLDDLNRIFLWKSNTETDVQEIVQNVMYKLGIDQETAYDRSLKRNNKYMGRGFFNLDKEHDAASLKKNARMIREEAERPLRDAVADSFRKIKALCERNRCQMVVVTTPIMRDSVLANGEYRTAMDAMEVFCLEEGIPYLNFTYAQGRSMPDFTGYYYDGYNHLDAKGLKMFDEPFARTMKAFFDGEDVSGLFMTKDEWMASFDWVTDAWMTREEREDGHVYTAYANGGTTVRCEYRFCLVDEEGNETVLQDYAENCEVKVNHERQTGTVRAYVRNRANPDQPALVCAYE